MPLPDHEGRYQLERPHYERFTNKLKVLLDELLRAKGIEAVLESGTKRVDRFGEKLIHPEKKYDDPLPEVTDLSGVRIVVRTISDARVVASLIAKEFAVDTAPPVCTGEPCDVDRFGYLSDRYIVQLKEPRTNLRDWNGFSGLTAELQVGTILQHAWASVQHSLDYKSSQDIPKKLRRRLLRLSAVFERADQELDQIANEASSLSAEYTEQVNTAPSEVELNVDSLRVYLETSPTVAHWVKFIEQLGVPIGPIGLMTRDIQMAKFAGLTQIGEIDALLNDARRWGGPYLREFFRNTFGVLNPTRNAMDRNGIITIFLIGEFQETFTDDILDREFGWGEPERATVPARRFNAKS